MFPFGQCILQGRAVCADLELAAKTVNGLHDLIKKVLQVEEEQLEEIGGSSLGSLLAASGPKSFSWVSQGCIPAKADGSNGEIRIAHQRQPRLHDQKSDKKPKKKKKALKDLC